MLKIEVLECEVLQSQLLIHLSEKVVEHGLLWIMDDACISMKMETP